MGQVCAGLGSSGQVWAGLCWIGQVWAGLGRFEQVWTGLGRFGIVETRLKGSTRVKSQPTLSDWTEKDPAANHQQGAALMRLSYAKSKRSTGGRTADRV